MVPSRRNAIVVGVVPASLILPGPILGRQRLVRISGEAIAHIATRRPDWLIFCLAHMAEVLGKPAYLGYRPRIDPRRVEFVRPVGEGRQYLLVAVKFLDEINEA